MSVTIDTNVLVYASNEGDRSHGQARALLERLAHGTEIVYLFWPVLLGYLRIVTHPAILPAPMAATTAMQNISELLRLPHVRAAGEAEGFWSTFSALADPGLRGNAVPDTHLVALMRQYDVGTLYTRDRGFRRFDGIRVRDLAA
jgi:hypothetical protein